MYCNLGMNTATLSAIDEAGIKTEVKEEMIDVEDEDEDCNAMALLELATCVQTNQEPIELNSTDAMPNPRTGLMVCLHCLIELESNLLTDHMINAHSYRRLLFKCNICTTKFSEIQLLILHKKDCQLPPKRQKRKSFLQIIKEVEKSKSLDGLKEFDSVSCPMCFLELPKCMLKEHLITEHKDPELSLVCDLCHKSFKSKLTLREHIKLVHYSKEDSVECEMCGQKFRSQKYLCNHKRNVHPKGDKIHKCEVCKKIFKSRLCLHQHKKNVHPPPSASVDCPHCPKTFKSKMNLSQHLKVSHGSTKKKK